MNKKIREERFCLYCGASLGTDWKSAKRKYCSNAHQAAYKAETLKKIWLETGQLSTSKPEKAKKDESGRVYRVSDKYTATKTSFVRNLILEEQNRVCGICSHDFMWQGKPVPAILDHINGDPFDNHRSNLRLICPMCASQLSTNTGGNKGSGRNTIWNQL